MVNVLRTFCKYCCLGVGYVVLCTCAVVYSLYEAVRYGCVFLGTAILFCMVWANEPDSPKQKP